MSSKDSKDVTSAVSKLSLDTQGALKNTKTNPKKEKVVDSWEDEDLSSDTETEDPGPTPSEGGSDGTSAPPPTPASPSYGQQSFSPLDSSSGFRATSESSSPAARPEKTDAVARRMIAAGLGLRVPRQTEEQKAYDKAVREKERKRREEEKAAQKRKEEEAAKAKAAMWDD
ncbi:hypothetical protein VM1G_03875 [Cytospora mali]|uniref:Ubiquitin-like protein smt3 n=1 Tax=Cytospora mali TaxID=578113 RepID=A0A194VZ37_CYTMA|nr:hypothetical protein VM1G_03875 [Valsa mali]